ncbi:hypothetical protein AMJ80_10660 [bacterium SM23_31]|nr:MAG: hypothetical protein AMJ80_10660 [bacterium SM23_31]
MNTVEKILEHLKTMPDSEHNEVLDFVEYLKTSALRRKQSEEDSQWGQFSLESAMRGIEKEPGLYGIEDIKEQFQ